MIDTLLLIIYDWVQIAPAKIHFVVDTKVCNLCSMSLLTMSDWNEHHLINLSIFYNNSVEISIHLAQLSSLHQFID